jgi:metal-sulfur cluster biosynthetic enzyme
MPETKVTSEQVLEAMKDVFDPEIPVNVVDLGLVYNITVDEKNAANVEMTLTAPGCGMGGQIAQQAEWRIAEIEGITDVHVEMVMEPPWTPEKITSDGKKMLGMD